MSTNFYLISGTADNREAGALTTEHIGKRSGGWAFTFNGQNFKTFHAWLMRLNNLGSQEYIEDEYGTRVEVVDFIAAIMDTLKPWGPSKLTPKTKDGPYRLGRVDYERDLTRNWVDRGFSFSNYEFS